MSITLNHTIVPVIDNEAAARFFASVMGPDYDYEGPDRHFAPVRVNDSLALDFMSVENPTARSRAWRERSARCWMWRGPLRSCVDGRWWARVQHELPLVGGGGRA